MSDYKTAYEMRQRIMLNFAEEVQYGVNWGPEFVGAQRRELDQWISHQRIDVTTFTSSECDILGFNTWNKAGLRLIPLWLYPVLKAGQKLTCIDNKDIIVTENYATKGFPDYIDNDHRAGSIAFGFYPRVIQ